METAVQNKVAGLVAPNAPANRVLLTLEGIHADEPPSEIYEVYINLPEGQEPDPRSDYYVGNLEFFGHFGQSHAHGSQAAPAQGQPSLKRGFDITRQVQALQARGAWQGGQPEVTFVRAQLLPPVGATPPPAALAPAPADAIVPVKIDRVSITTV
jgi:hypothetical protein